MTLKVYGMTSEQFDELRDAGRLVAERYYAVSYRDGTAQVAWSPDGIGCFWYEDITEAVYEHGTEEEWTQLGLTMEGYEEWAKVQEARRA